MQLQLLLVLVALIASDAWNMDANRKIVSVNQSQKSKFIHVGTLLSKSLLASSAVLLTTTSQAHAGPGGIKASTAEETKKAILQLKSCIDKVKSMNKDLEAGNFQAMGDKLSDKDFLTFEDAATTIVRSDLLTQDEKTALGTIRRYGVVADAIIMLGGLSGELKAGGVKISGGGSSSNDIESDDDDEDDAKTEAVPINVSEVKRYIKLSEGSLEDIYTIVKPILNK